MILTLDGTKNIKPPTNIVAVSILLLLELPIAIAVLVQIFEDPPLTIGCLLAQVILVLAVAMTIGGLSLFQLGGVLNYFNKQPEVIVLFVVLYKTQ
jgi:hypothetical protein